MMEERASPISIPLTSTRIAMTARMKPCRGAVSNNDDNNNNNNNNNNNSNNNNKKKGDFCSLHLPHEVGAQGQCMHRVWGLPDIIPRREAGDV